MNITQVLAWLVTPEGLTTLAAIGTLGSLGATWAVKNNPAAREFAQEAVDAAEAAEPWVRQFEPYLLARRPFWMPLPSSVLDQYEAWCAEQGIQGDAKRFLDKRIKQIVKNKAKEIAMPTSAGGAAK